VIRKGMYWKIILVLSLSKLPSRVLALHGKLPRDGALHDLVLIGSRGLSTLVERHQHLSGVVGVGIKLVIEFKIPAARSVLRTFTSSRPCGGTSLRASNPRLEHARVVARCARLAQGKDRLRVSHTATCTASCGSRLRHRFAGRLLDAQLFKLIARPDHLRSSSE